MKRIDIVCGEFSGPVGTARDESIAGILLATITPVAARFIENAGPLVIIPDA